MDPSLPKGLTPQGKAWGAFVAQEAKTQQATNSNQYFLVGRSLLNKSLFNKLNTEEDGTIHGMQVVYGPFDSMQRMHEFIADYPFDWPGENDWRYIHPGQPDIITSYFEPGKAELVHNKTLDFQGQIGYNEMTRRIKEIEDTQARMRKKEETPGVFTTEELTSRAKWQRTRIQDVTHQLEQMKAHLAKLDAELAKRASSSENA